MSQKRRVVLKRNDRRPALVLKPIISADTGNNLGSMSGATAVFTMVHAETGVTKVSRQNAVLDLTGGELVSATYSWAAADTNAVGTYKGEFEITDPGSLPFTLPNEVGWKNIEIEIIEDLDAT